MSDIEKGMNPKDRLITSRNRELEAVLEVSRVLTGSFDLQENLTAAMETLGIMLDLERGCVFLRDGETDELRIIAAHGLTRDEISRGIYKAGEGIVGSVIESGQPMFIPDIGAEPKFLNRTGSRPTKKGISFICVPIMLKGAAMGVLSVDRIYSDERGGLDDDLRVLGIVSWFIAQFVAFEGYARQGSISLMKPRWEHALANPGSSGAGSLRDEVINLERERMIRALTENSFVQHRAATALGITPRQFGYRLRKYGIDPDALKYATRIHTDQGV